MRQFIILLEKVASIFRRRKKPANDERKHDDDIYPVF